MRRLLKSVALVLSLVMLLGTTAYAAGSAFDTEPDILDGVDYFEDVVQKNNIRSSGKTRWLTSTTTADQFKLATDQTDGFDCIVVASGDKFPDALCGSYLAYRKNAPIILLPQNASTDITTQINYITSNLKSNGTIYILGGTGAVPENIKTAVLAAMPGVTVTRIKGTDRYETNLKILSEAQTGTIPELIICCGDNYADALSASALGKPILLVSSKATELTAEQEKYINDNKANLKKIYILGGTAAVTDALMNDVAQTTGLSVVSDAASANDGVRRIKGANRYATSVAVAKVFFGSSLINISVAYGHNFPDGLTGGVLSKCLGAPIVLTREADQQQLLDYMDEVNPSNLVVYGGSGVISDNYYNTLTSKLDN